MNASTSHTSLMTSLVSSDLATVNYLDRRGNNTSWANVAGRRANTDGVTNTSHRNNASHTRPNKPTPIKLADMTTDTYAAINRRLHAFMNKAMFRRSVDLPIIG